MLLRVFVLFCVFVFVRAILSWWLLTWHVYIVYNILSVNISSVYIRPVYLLDNFPMWLPDTLVFLNMSLRNLHVCSEDQIA